MTVGFWDSAIIYVYFVYGLAFYSLGLALFTESGRSSKLPFARSMRLLAGFGVLHGFHEWIAMVDCGCQLFYAITLPEWLIWLQVAILVASFISLIAFAEHMLARNSGSAFPKRGFTVFLLLLYSLSAIIVQPVYQLNEHDWRLAMDVLARYILGIPGALLVCRSLWQQHQIFIERNMNSFARSLKWAIVGFFLFGVVGQIFPLQSMIPPSNVVNDALFLTMFGFPIQLLRAVIAVLITVALIRVLRSLEVENEERMRLIESENMNAELKKKRELEILNQQLQKAHSESQQLLEEVRKRDMLRGELLQHITAAQEAERQRIARELHDDTGQVLTGLALGLRGLTDLVHMQPELARKRLEELQLMATSAISELRYLIQDLRPSQLDDIGLVAALRTMQERLVDIHNINIQIMVVGDPFPLSGDVSTTLFRIAQEGITNALKHANPTEIKITIDYSHHIKLTVQDNGCGFDVDEALSNSSSRKSWGLLGVHERSRLVNADLHIVSKHGAGTTLTVELQADDARKVTQ